jgi:trehalose synthase
MNAPTKNELLERTDRPADADDTSWTDPLWYKDAIIYQLHVKSFFDGNNDGIGDFAGLISKLDYIRELGATAIWLLPFYPSPLLDDGYDISEYRKVNSDYGTIADVRRFIRAARERGLRVIAELVVNHTSDQHPWFQRARHAPPGSAAREFYVWSKTGKEYGGTRIIFLDTERSNWTWDPVANAYYWHRFYSHQPDLNFDNPRVLKEILAIMRFWFEMGIDGLRLDAVPYLIERDGTSNENLPETHAVLKTIRAELDRRFKGRMLLAEANQWPEDAKDYFGDGDECHMAFHFPLMPRMYMAIGREDRFPITDIMRQTPAIPENCQWAIFLRNHDELTLEMVTDNERDYLWQVYAADRRARINLGIRRRLTPLVERDRRRVELLNFLLLAMPGTPIIYYGDEIGMGDNIHLGDRNGVRTPRMVTGSQWWLLARRSCRAHAAAHHGSALRLRGGQCRVAEPRPAFAAELDAPHVGGAAATSRARPRVAALPLPEKPENSRLLSRICRRDNSMRREPVAKRASGRARLVGIQWTRTDRAQQWIAVPADRAADLSADASALRLLLVSSCCRRRLAFLAHPGAGTHARIPHHRLTRITSGRPPRRRPAHSGA